MKNCVFQYATGYGDIKQDTGLITEEDAVILWNTYIPVFKSDSRKGLEPEMCIWVNMNGDSDFRETSKHWCSSEMVLEDGILYTKQRVG